MRIASYLRVSTDGQGLEPQRSEILKFCQARKWPHPEEYADILSASRLDREELSHLVRDIRAGVYQVVIAVKLDRLARSLSHFSCLMETFRKHNVALVLTSQGIDTTSENPMGKMQLGMLAVFAEFERELIRERTKAGLIVARAKGKTLGRPSPTLSLDFAAIIEAWKAAGGRNYRRLAADLGGVSTATAWKLANPCTNAHN